MQLIGLAHDSGSSGLSRSAFPVEALEGTLLDSARRDELLSAPSDGGVTLTPASGAPGS